MHTKYFILTGTLALVALVLIVVGAYRVSLYDSELIKSNDGKEAETGDGFRDQQIPEQGMGSGGVGGYAETPQRDGVPPEEIKTDDTVKNPTNPTNSTDPAPTPVATGGCVVGGCSNQVCGEVSVMDGLMTTCEYRPEYACYTEATCERQTTGKCGWTDTPELRACIANSGFETM